MPKAVAAALFAQHKAEKGTIRCRGRRLQSREDARATDPKRRNPLDDSYLFTAYEAKAWISANQVQLYKTPPADEAAPAATQP